jgi:hypothetical protein
VHQRMETLDIKPNRPTSSSSTLTLRKKGKYLSAWDVVGDLTLRILSVSQLNCDKGVQVISSVDTIIQQTEQIGKCVTGGSSCWSFPRR